MRSFVTSFFPFQGSSMLECISVLPFFLLLNNIPLYGYTTFYLPIHPLTHVSIHQLYIWVVSTLAIMNNVSINTYV